MNDESIPNKTVILRASLDGLDQVLLTKSHMWIEPLQWSTLRSVEEEKFEHFVTRNRTRESPN